jgi:nicotinate-nucleotide adenylyltransferase
VTLRRIGVLGGTFDPVHIGHLAGAEEAAWRLGLDRVLFVPNNVPPHKLRHPVSAPEHRLAMVQSAIADNPLFEALRTEIDRDGPSHTLDTMRQLRRELGPETQPVFLAGLDALRTLASWHRPDELVAEFELAFLARPDSQPVDWRVIARRFPQLRKRARLVDIPELEVSGSDIRDRVREGRPIRYYVTPPVQQYIQSHRLYRD